MLTIRFIDPKGQWLEGKPEVCPIRKLLGPRYSEASGMHLMLGKNTEVFPLMEMEFIHLSHL